MSMPASPGYQPGQGTAGGTDVVTQLRGIISQLSSSNTNLLTLISAIQGINFPQTVKSYTVSTLPSSPAAGTIVMVTDGASGATWGSVPTGGHSTPYIVWYTGSAWHVMGS